LLTCPLLEPYGASTAIFSTDEQFMAAAYLAMSLNKVNEAWLCMVPMVIIHS
jgi:hypothetical protein